ncbi:MAG: LysR family transcriptional regulator [Deltaproteobacteria bacterium]|nr:MAG: LysR family transcriptional regulator [Deltaproteobacteria bacterium]
MVDIQGVVEFVRVVETGSFTVAARQLRRSKSYVSQQVARIEDRLGTRLLLRTTRKLALTEAGELYLRYARQVVRQLEEGEERVRDFERSPRGPIRVSLVDGGLGEWYLAPELVRFAAANPGVRVELDLSSRLVDLIGEGFDFAVRVGELEDSSLKARRLTSFRYGLYAAPAYLERHGLPASPADLRPHNCLSGAAARWRLGNGTEVADVIPRGNWHSKSGQVLVAAAAQGLGIVRVASFYAAEALASGALVEVLHEWTRALTPVWIVHPSGRHVPHRVQCAMRHLLEAFRHGPPWDRSAAAIGHLSQSC